MINTLWPRDGYHVSLSGPKLGINNYNLQQMLKPLQPLVRKAYELMEKFYLLEKSFLLVLFYICFYFRLDLFTLTGKPNCRYVQAIPHLEI